MFRILPAEVLLRPGDKDRKITFNMIADLLTGRVCFWREVFIPGIARALGKILKNSGKLLGIATLLDTCNDKIAFYEQYNVKSAI